MTTPKQIISSHCRRCGHDWNRPKLLKCCPKCRRATWNRDLKSSRSSDAGLERIRIAKTIHGHMDRHKPSRTYNSWRAMISRCENENNEKYQTYGKCGIKVCDRWHFFECFLADMGERPEGKTLDRKDGSKGYSPDNCRWATPSEQALNSSRIRWVTYRGRSFPITHLAKIHGVHITTLTNKLNRGMSAEDALR
jgi:hypothetical protein